jgi:hypothetical protein
MVARPTEVSTDIHPYDVVPTHSLGLPPMNPHGWLASALLRVVHRVGARHGGVSVAKVKLAPSAPVEVRRKAGFHSRAAV